MCLVAYAKIVYEHVKCHAKFYGNVCNNVFVPYILGCSFPCMWGKGIRCFSEKESRASQPNDTAKKSDLENGSGAMQMFHLFS
jgi:hypothetical protein